MLSQSIFAGIFDVACPVQNPEHFDGISHRPLVDDVRGDEETAKPRPNLVAALPHAGKADMHPTALQDGVDQPVGGIGVARRDLQPSLVEVSLGLFGKLWLAHAWPRPF